MQKTVFLKIEKIREELKKYLDIRNKDIDDLECDIIELNILLTNNQYKVRKRDSDDMYYLLSLELYIDDNKEALLKYKNCSCREINGEIKLSDIDINSIEIICCSEVFRAAKNYG